MSTFLDEIIAASETRINDNVIIPGDNYNSASRDEIPEIPLMPTEITSVGSINNNVVSINHVNRGFTVRPGTKPGFTEVIFKAKPAEAIRSRLKNAGFRWSSFNKLWYGRTNNLPEYFRS